MNLKGIVSVTGKPGLYKVVGQNKSGFILETLDEAKNKLLINPNTRIAALKEITIFGLDDDIRLLDVFETMKTKAEEIPMPAPKVDNKTLREYFEKISPDHDPERVYASDIKKIVSWYGILSELPLFEEKDEEEEDTTASEAPGSEAPGSEAPEPKAAEPKAAKADEAKAAHPQPTKKARTTASKKKS